MRLEYQRGYRSSTYFYAYVLVYHPVVRSPVNQVGLGEGREANAGPVEKPVEVACATPPYEPVARLGKLLSLLSRAVKKSAGPLAHVGGSVEFTTFAAR
jgi:hypothetical protein